MCALVGKRFSKACWDSAASSSQPRGFPELSPSLSDQVSGGVEDEGLLKTTHCSHQGIRVGNLTFWCYSANDIEHDHCGLITFEDSE